MTKILFLQITLSHLCFLVQYKPFPSHQHCVTVFRVLCSLRACHNCPVSRQMHTPMECLCMCAKLCIFCATIERKLYAIIMWYLLLNSLTFATFFFIYSFSCRLRHCFQEDLELGVNTPKNIAMLVSGIIVLAHLFSNECLLIFLSGEVRESVSSTSVAVSYHLAWKRRVRYHLLHQGGLGKGFNWQEPLFEDKIGSY